MIISPNYHLLQYMNGRKSLDAKSQNLQKPIKSLYQEQMGGRILKDIIYNRIKTSNVLG